MLAARVCVCASPKVVAVWKYDKRAVNGQRAPTVYFGTDLQPLAEAPLAEAPLAEAPLAEAPLEGAARPIEEGEEGLRASASASASASAVAMAAAAAEYVVRVLGACGLKDGPAHTEVTLSSMGRPLASLYVLPPPSTLAL